jgi:uncharacterized protein
MLLYRADQEKVAPSRSWRALRRLALVLDPLTVGRGRRTLSMAVRVALVVTGAVILAGCVAVMLWNNIGAGPLDVFIVALRDHTGLPLAFAVWLTVGTLTLVAWALGRRPGVATLAVPLIAGPTMQWMLSGLDHFDPPHMVAARIAIHLVAVGVVGIGVGCIVASHLGQATGELLATAASQRSGRPEPRVRLACEVTFLVVGGLMGGPIGLGTVLIALCIGPSVARGCRTVASGLDMSRKQLSAAYAALPR